MTDLRRSLLAVLAVMMLPWLSACQTTMSVEEAKSYAHPIFWAPFALVGDGRN